MTAQFDLNAYLSRIGYTGERTPTLQTLSAIHALQPAVIPFENLNPLLGLPVSLDLEALQRKLVQSHRGGYCFEQNLLFKTALEHLGFEVTGLAARVIWNRTDDAITPRTHMVLLVTLGQERYICDVGFGGQTLTSPLPFSVGIEHQTRHEPFRVIEQYGNYFLQTKVRDVWRSMYRFDLQPQYPQDYHITNWYVSTHPESQFVNTLRVARSVPGRRYGLLNNELSTHTLGAESTSRTLISLQELKTILSDLFTIELPEHPELDARLRQFVQTS
jgi:N-hydroxyarylamine O-acetyltransferase